MAVYSKKATAERRKALKQGEERFRALILHSVDAIQLLSAEGSILYSSDSIERVLGYKEERQRLLNQASEKLVASLDHQITLQEIAQLLVPSMADYCRIALQDNQQQIKDRLMV